MKEHHHPNNRPKIGIVLSSGGLNPISALPLFEFLKEENITYDLLVGCSGGGIMAAFHAIGYDTDAIIDATQEFLSQKAFAKVDYRTLLNIGGLPFGRFDLNKGLLKQNLPLEMCQKLFGDYQLEELPIKTIYQTTDIQNGEGVVLEKGSLAEAVYASAAMYPLLPPINIDGRWLVDGAFSSPLPALEAVKRNMDIIIVISFHENPQPDPTNFWEGFRNIIKVFSLSLTKSQLSLAIDLHHFEIIVIDVPYLKTYSLSDPTQIPELIEIGNKVVDLKKEEILDAIKSYQNQEHL